MNLVAIILILYVILFHLCAFVLESFLWRKPIALKFFGTTKEAAAASHTLAMNQGVYNLFIAAGLLFSFAAADSVRFAAQIFILSCVVVTGVVGGLTSSKRIMLVQALPALIALALLLLGR